MFSQNCKYCGNNQVPHAAFWYFETLDVLFAPIRRALVYNTFSLFVKKFLAGKKFGWHLANFLLKLHVLGQNFDMAKCKVKRAKVLWEEGQKRGIKMSELLLFGKGIDVYLAEKQANQLISQSANKPVAKLAMVFSGLPRPKSYDGRTAEAMDDKINLKQKLSREGLPVPAGGSAYSLKQAQTIFQRIQKPVIVKPRTGSRGRHTTTYIYTEQELNLAVKVAKQLCFWVVVEEQLMGPVYRATVINGKLAGVLRGDSPTVAGDGKHSIAELVEIKNSQAHPGVSNIVLDSNAELFLTRQNLELSSVLSKGQQVSLTEKIGVNYGGSSSEDFEICHQDNKELFLRAAKILKDPIVGFDFIIADITKSWKSQKCGFIEANSLPFINLHHDPLHGQPRNAAALVWDMMGW